MNKKFSLPEFQYQIVKWWKKHTDGKLPKGNELKHLAQQNLMVSNRLIAYFGQEGANPNDIQDELVIMIQNIMILAHCTGLNINDVFDMALPREDKDE